MEPLKTPDVTLMQKLVAAVGGLIVAAVGLVNAFGWYDVSGNQTGAVMGLWAAVGSVLVLADAIIRNGRARAFVNQPKGAVVSGDGTGTTLPGVLEETAPGYSGERIVYREDTEHRPLSSERDLGA